MAKPGTLPVWDSNQSNSIVPSAGKQTDGWPAGPASPVVSTYLNFWQNLVYLWLVWLNGLWDGSGNLTLDTNASVTLSGTGLLKHGARVLECAPIATHCVVGAGSVTADAFPGAIVAINSTIYFPLHGVQTHWRITTVVITLGAAAANSVTYDVFQSDTGAGSRTWVHSGITSVSTTASTITITLNTSYASPIWVSVVTGGTTGATVKSVSVNYDVV